MTGAKKGGLGKGLGALLPSKRDAELQQCPLDRIKPAQVQPRTAFDEDALEELAASLKMHGLLQPIVVRPTEDGYSIIAGERRYQAAKRAGLTSVPVVVRDLSDSAAYELALVENIQRENLNAMEEARAFCHLVEDFSYTHAQLAERMGKSRSAVSNALRLVDLPLEVQALVEGGGLSAGHARALLGLKGAEAQLALAQRVLAEQLNVRALEKLVKEALKRPAKGRAGRKESALEPYFRQVEEELARGCGLKARCRRKGSRTEVAFLLDSVAQLEDLLRRVSRET
jgi:ParB family chromosome partitioning protein